MEEELKEIEKIRTIPEEVKKEINNKVYESIFISALLMLLCVLLLVGYKYIWPDNYIVDLNVLSVIALVISLITIERAYKKDSGKLAVNAVEAIVIALTLLSFPYLVTYYRLIFPGIVTFMSAMFGVYYSIKGIVLIYRERKKYRRSVSDIEEIEEKEGEKKND